MSDLDITQALARLGVDRLSIRALAAMPMVYTVWADGSTRPAEKVYVLKLADEQLGIGEEGAVLLSDWLRHRPSREYMALALEALHLLATQPSGGLDDVDLDQTIALAHQIALSSRGCLRFFRPIGPSETRALKELAARFAAVPTMSPAPEESAPDPNSARRMTTMMSASENFTGVLIVEADGERRKTPVDRDGVVVGMGEEASVRVSGTGIAKAHCRVFLRRRKFYIQNLPGTNGTFVNDERVGERRLLGGESIRVGDALITFKMGLGSGAA